MAEEKETGTTAGGETAPRRCAIVAVVGPANAGKSTLVNALVGAKVTIVSRKVQTTRSPVRGIVIEGASQLVFVDTPGIFEPRRRLDRAMVATAWARAADADAVVLVVDAAKGVDPGVEGVADKLAEVGLPRILVLNKVDRVAEKDKLLGLVDALSARVAFDRVFMVSALTGDGVADLKAHLAAGAPEGPWLYPEDELSDMPERLLAAEVTRERIYDRLHDELPYETTVETTSWKDLKDGSVRIEQTIFVARESQKGIVVGTGGQTIKALSSEARTELSRLLGRPVHLFLFVKVRQRWDEDRARYAEMGLEPPEE
jgi:GTP-binding protein Era